MGTLLPGVPYTDPTPDQVTTEVNGDRAADTATATASLATIADPAAGGTLGRWQRAAVSGRDGVARAKVLAAFDSYGVLGYFTPMVSAFQQSITGALPVIPGLGFTQAADFTGGTMQSDGWNCRNKVVAPGSPITAASRIFLGATAYFGASPGATIELWVAGSKVGETSAAAAGRLDVPSASAIGVTAEIRATGANVNFYGLYGHQNLTTAPTTTSGVEIMMTAFSGLGISTVVSTALAESIAFASAYNPDLLVMGHFINSSESAYATAMDTFLAAFRAVCPTTSIVLMVMPQAAGRDDAPSTRRHAYELAARYDCAVCDTFEVLGDLEGSAFTSDGTHLNAAGTAVFADRLVRDLGSPLTPKVGATAADGIRTGAGTVVRQDYLDGKTVVTSASTPLTLTVAQTKRHIATMTSGSANTVNLPLGATVGAEVDVIQLGVGATTVACPGGTITGPALTATARYQMFRCVCIAANTWNVGRLT